MALVHKAMLQQTARKPMARIVQDYSTRNERSVQLPLERSVHAQTGSVIKARAKVMRLGQREMSKGSGLPLGTVNAVLNEVGGSDESLRCLDESVRKDCAKLLRFFADVMEGIA